MNNLSSFHFRSGMGDRVTDNRAEWHLKMDEHIRANSPRQRRLEAQRRFLLARYHETFSAIAGGILLVVIILCLAFIA
jgi:hypothetical protein